MPSKLIALLIRHLSLIVGGLGVLLALIQWVFNRSLWLDEAMLSINLVEKSAGQLLLPLSYNQMAPIGFLELEKVMITIFGNGEMALRALPLMAFILLVYLFYYVVHSFEMHAVSKALAMAFVVFNPVFFYYANEVKQYMTDALLAVSILYMLRMPTLHPLKRMYAIALIGCVGIFVSNAVVPVLIGASLYIFFQKRDWWLGRCIHPLAICFMWLSLFMLYYSLFLHNHPVRGVMMQFWFDAGAFMPLNSASDFMQFIAHKYEMFAHELFQFSKVGGVCLTVLFAAGLVYVFRTGQRSFLIIVLVPVLVHAIVSSFGMYPFDVRLLLYTVPGLAIILALGVQYLYYQFSFEHSTLNAPIIRRQKTVFNWFAAILLLLCGIRLFGVFPMQKEEIKKAMEFIASQSSPRFVYLYYGAVDQYHYYDMTNRTPLTKEQVRWGNAFRKEPERYYTDWLYQGAPNVILFSHIYENEDQLLIRQIEDHGNRTKLIFEAAGVKVYEVEQ